MEAQNEYRRLNRGKSGWRVRVGRRGQAIRSKLFGKKSNELGIMENSNFPILFGDNRSNATPDSESPSNGCTSTKNTHHPEALNMGLNVDTLENDHHMETCQISIHSKWIFGRVLDPRSRAIRKWNRFFLLICGLGLAIDPLFFYALSVSEGFMCLYVDGWFAITVTVLRSMCDAMHLWNIWLQLKLAYVSKESLVVGSGKLVTDPRSIALHYLGSRKGLLFDVFVILPFPQIVLWAVAPVLIEKGEIVMVMSVFLIMFLFQYLPKVYHSICLLRRMQHITGYVFGTIWAGFALNMLAYFVAAHAAGGCWYLLGIQRTAKCLQKQCEVTNGCDYSILGCVSPIIYGSSPVRNPERLVWEANATVHAICIKGNGKFNFGAYKWVVPLVINTNRIEKILFPIFWGLMTLSTFGNLESTTEWLEVIFNIIILTSGLLLVTMLIGNIKVPLFQHMDELVLENICDRVKSMLFTKGETIAREGDPVQRMLFIVRGHFRSTNQLTNGVTSSCMLGPGNFCGDELLSWCLRRPFKQRLPLSSATVTSIDTTEAFGLEAKDIIYVTQHFRYTFLSDKLKRTARYYSPGWRTWAAVAIQLAWRRHKARFALSSLSFIRMRRPLSRSYSEEDRLRLYAALLVSPKPHDDDFVFPSNE
ncbi:cyclic nucleotide-gated ion channel 4 isoform X2 [Cryptomeria japonica]|uniref:cyclic nucleotide-gated ion channel 4 isoform X2 n=1 Tax=Cryptomeria japonica TaxID=3369 RepID=UPI0027D9CF39|nr:cyclic nucleotide-gated ion channel 4 isoform X2 [Cryptomeria japonica]